MQTYLMELGKGKGLQNLREKEKKERKKGSDVVNLLLCLNEGKKDGGKREDDDFLMFCLAKRSK